MEKLNIPNLSVLKGGIDVADANAKNKEGLQLPSELAAHPVFGKVFKKESLTFGLIAPFKGYADHIPEELNDLGETAKLAEKLGYSALWVRDVPFFDPNFGDVGQGYDPMVTLGYLAAHTKDIAIGTAGFVAPLRSPIHLAKAAASMDRLTNSRFLLGMSSGDRPIEYPAFQADFENRAGRFQESIQMIRTLTEQSFPRYKGNYYGDLNGDIDLVPKPNHRLPIVTIGRARQDLTWIANESDAWIWYASNGKQVAQLRNTLAELGDGKTWKPFGSANFIDLSDDPYEPAQLFNNVYLRGGSVALAEYYAELKENGLSHVTMNLKPTKRPTEEALQELAENVVEKLK